MLRVKPQNNLQHMKVKLDIKKDDDLDDFVMNG